MELLVASGVGLLTMAGIFLVLRAQTFPLVLGLTFLSYAVNIYLFAMGRLVVDQPPILSKMQWNFFLDITGFRAVADAAVKAMPKNTLEEKTVWAGMNAAINSSDYYRQGMALRLVERVRAMKLGVQLPTDDEVKAAWALAATFSLATLEG